MSFLVLLLTTKNFYISVMAILSISAIILGLMSMVNLFGWEFGIIESTCVIIFIGISVDYVVHICHQYIHAMDNQRKQRMDFAFKNMGATILGGALTSSFSAFFLIICQADSLNKFGILLLTTIISSMIVSLVFLPGVIYIIGPNKQQGDLEFLVTKCKK
tara:strand:+ start:1716 stop:2195 length:480 start_codon:yes stop_codon:yes gene_type:complete